MRTLKKNLFGIGLAFSIILGVAFSFVPQKVEAYVGMEEEGYEKNYVSLPNCEIAQCAGSGSDCSSQVTLIVGDCCGGEEQ